MFFPSALGVWQDVGDGSGSYCRIVVISQRSDRADEKFRTSGLPRLHDGDVTGLVEEEVKLNRHCSHRVSYENRVLDAPPPSTNQPQTGRV